MNENNIKHNYLGYIFVMILNSILVVLVWYCFSKEYYITGSITTLLILFGFICSYWGIVDENEHYKELINKQEEEKRKHAEEQRIASLTDFLLVEEICQSLLDKTSLDHAKNRLISLPEESRKFTLGAAFNKLVTKILDDHFVDDDEEKILSQFITEFKEIHELDEYASNHQKEISVIDDICKLKRFISLGVQAARNPSIGCMLNFQKDEFAFCEDVNVDYYEDLKGLGRGQEAKLIPHPYSRGTFYGREGFADSYINTQNLIKRANSGRLILTNKSIYFVSSNKTIKIPYDKILMYYPYKDALCFQKDGINAKPQVFTNIDGWLFYNLVNNIK